MKTVLNAFGQGNVNPYADQVKAEREKRVWEIAAEAASAKKVQTLGGPALLIGNEVINITSLDAELYVDVILEAIGANAKKNPRG